MMNIKDVAQELGDGFEEESTSDALVKSQGGGLFPARPCADPWSSEGNSPRIHCEDTITTMAIQGNTASHQRDKVNPPPRAR
jgi:hypothetical protein